MPQTQQINVAEVLIDRAPRTDSWNRRTVRGPKSGQRSREAGTVSHGSFKDELGAQIPRLRAFAVSLCGSSTLADDLVQEALLRAWANSEKFQPGTNLRAWLCTILRNVFYSHHRKRSREVQDSDGEFSRGIAVAGNQESHLDLADLRIALAKLPAEQREVLILVGASGASYEEAATICGVEIGTIKSRASRARAKLSELMGLYDRRQTNSTMRSSAYETP
jgi:RNA polymerase sigma-70 factor (ECF subfamily)